MTTCENNSTIDTAKDTTGPRHMQQLPNDPDNLLFPTLSQILAITPRNLQTPMKKPDQYAATDMGYCGILPECAHA